MFKKKEKKEPDKGKPTEVTEAPTHPEKEEEATQEVTIGTLNNFEASVFQRLDYIANTLIALKQEQEKIKEMIEKEISQ